MSKAVLKKTYQFKDLLLLTKDGEWGPDAPADDAVPMYLIRGTDFDDVRYGKLNDVPVRYVKSRAAELKTLRPNDVLLETAGGTRDQPTGRSVFLKKSLFAKATHKICCASFSRFLRFNPELVCPEYMYWWLQAKYLDGTSYEYHVQHTGVARFQYTQFAKSVSVDCPFLSEQKAIASILGALDDKIELNRRMNATLEAMARALFKSWFVDFDPVRAKSEGRQPFDMDAETAALFPSRLIPSTLGDIPEGWSIGTMKDLVALQNG